MYPTQARAAPSILPYSPRVSRIEAFIHPSRVRGAFGILVVLSKKDGIIAFPSPSPRNKCKPSADWFDILFDAPRLLTEGSLTIYRRLPNTLGKHWVPSLSLELDFIHFRSLKK